MATEYFIPTTTGRYVLGYGKYTAKHLTKNLTTQYFIHTTTGRYVLGYGKYTAKHLTKSLLAENAILLNSLVK